MKSDNRQDEQHYGHEAAPKADPRNKTRIAAATKVMAIAIDTRT